MNRTTLFAGALLPTFLLGLALAQQKDAPAAPVPPQISEAKRIFISNAGQENNPDSGIFGEYSGGPNRTYNQFYFAMKNWGRYDLAASPADCDLVFEIRFTDRIAGNNVFKGESVGPSNEPQFRVVIMDPKTRVVLWGFTEHVRSAHLQGNRDKNFDQAMAKMVQEVKDLVAPAAAAGASAKN